MPKKVLPISVEQLQTAVSKYGTPLQLYDEHTMVTNTQNLFKLFRAKFPDFQQFFAVKALPNPAILALLIEQGCGLDCSSTSELWIAEKLGVPPSQVMYTSNYTSEKDLAVAAKQGVIINLDDASLIPTLAKVNGGKTPDLMSFRLNPGLVSRLLLAL